MKVLLQTAAALEVFGRHVVERVPGLRARVGRWARRTPAKGCPVTLGELERRLRELGTVFGRDLLVHSSWDGLRQLEAKPSAVLELLRRLAGDGTLVMPSHPVERRVDGLLTYDAQRSPTRMGLLAESLRRSSGARRSPYPIAPVAVLGPEADRYARDFRVESGNTPYGRGSPWHTLAERGGQILVLGVAPVRVLTMMHVAFDLLGDENPIPDFYFESTWRVIRGGTEDLWKVRSQRPSLEKYLATAAFARLMTQAGVVAERADDGLRLAWVDARRFLDWHLPLARSTGLPYWGFARGSR